jgi:predicted MFS family arabinose efflux permease
MKPLVPIFIVGIIFWTLYAIIQLVVRRKERVMLIEKGMSAPEMKPETLSFSSLKFGLLFIGIGAGALIGNILSVTTALDTDVAYFSMIFLFGGLALIISHFLEKKKPF